MIIVFSLLILLNIALYMCGEFQYKLKILQLKDYNILSVFKLLKVNYLHKILLIILGLIMLFFYLFGVADYILMGINLMLCLVYNLITHNRLKKENPKYTKRIVRLIVLVFLIFTLLFFTIIFDNILPCIICLLLVTFDFVTIISIYMTNIVENLILKYYTKKAVNKLNKTKIIKIAIVGSYGKTSVKNILADILKEKYSVLITPESYNTPNGLALTINKNDIDKYQIFIMEMGAKRKGDITWLCKKYKPDFAILTAIGKQHLETFKTIEKIIDTKSEVLQFVKMCVFNVGNDYVKDVSTDYTGDKILVGDECDLYATNVNLSSELSSFKIIYHDQFFGEALTILTGSHNVDNILMAVAMAIKLGLSDKQILRGISNIKPIKSRMEKSVLSSGAIVINNGYNSNPDSACKSIDMVNLYSSKNKIIVTPGFVEMGDKQYALNFELGCLIAENFQKCIVVNKVNRESLLDGLKSKGFDNYDVVDKFKDIDFAQFSNNDIILIENDLPDSYE